MVELPTFQVGVAWSDELTGVFRVGVSQLDSTSDVLGGGFGYNDFDDLTSYVRAVTIQRGRTDDLEQMQQGICSIQLYDSTGRFNPESTSSDLAGMIVPMRPVRISAGWDGSTYRLFFGYVERVEFDPANRITTIDAVDFFEWLANSNKSFTPAATSTNVGASIGEFLDQLEFTDPAYRAIDDGRSITEAFALAGNSYLDQIGLLLQYDRGVVFVEGNGTVRFIEGERWWAHGTPSATLDGDLASDMRITTDKQRIVNRQVVTFSEVEYSTYDDASRRRYGWRDGEPIDTAYVANSTEALDLARWVIATRKDPIAPIRAIEVKAASTAAIRNQLELDIGDWVAWGEPIGGTTSEGVIEGIEHEVSVDALPLTRYLVSKRRVNAFTLDVSVLDGTDVLGWA